MSDDGKKSGPSLALIVPWVLSLLTVGVGIFQFSTQQAQANRQPFLQRQLELVFQASNAAAILATEPDPVEWEKARRTFWRLYWGPLSIVEDREVEAAMVVFGRGVPTAPVTADKLPMAELRQPSLRLALAARGLVLKSWGISLPELEVARAPK